MGGTNVTQTPTTESTIEPVSGNIGAGGQVMNSTVMPLDLAGGSNNTVSITDTSPQAISAAVGIANAALNSNMQVMEMATQANELVTTGVINQSGSIATQALGLAGSSTGSGPVQGIISSVGKYAVAALVFIIVILGIAFSGRKEKA